jgi:hypothetical protein
MRTLFRAFILLLLPLAAIAQSSSTIVPLPPATSGTAITPSAKAPVAPAPAKAPEAISPEALREAKALTEMLGVPTQAKTVMSQVRDQVIAATVNASGKSSAEAAAIADEIVMPEFASREQELVNLLTVPWALGFTPAEMRELRAFYATTLGKRVLATMPRVTQQSVQVGQEWMQKTFREAIAKHADELHARGLKF